MSYDDERPTKSGGWLTYSERQSMGTFERDIHANFTVGDNLLQYNQL